MIKYLKILTTILLLFPLWGQGGYLFAQNYPVQCTPILSPPYTLSWVEYGSSPERLKVQLLLKDLTKPSVEVSLRIRLKGIGVVIENTPDFYTSSPITLLPGVPVMLSGAMLRENFKYENLTAQGVDLEALYAGASLPSGFYQWEITAFLADQRQVSNVGMAMMTVFKNNPPQITFPQNNAVLMNTGFQSINFTWMPRHRYSTNAAAGTVYTFKIYEIPNEEDAETDPNIIVNSGVLPLFSTQSFGTNYTYKPSDPLLVPGRRYVIQVQAADINGQDEFENNGLSEVSTFLFGNPSEAPALKLCKKPSNFLAEKLDEQSVQLTWQETNSETPIDYLVSYKTENEAIWTEKIVSDPTLMLVQLSPAKYQFKVSARCAYDNKSAFTNEMSVILESPKPEKTPEVEPQDTYVNTDPEPVTPSEYEPEQTKEPAINIFNTPIKIILDSENLKNLPDSLQLPKGYEKLGSLPVLSDKPTIEDLKAALQTQKIDCSSYLAGYSCGQHDAPAVPSGDIIQVKTGDEIAINSVGFEVVELDGSGNGKGIVKVSMFNNAKFGVEFKGIKVAKGGCVVAGEAVLSNVDVALLSEEQRKKLAETYAAFNKVLDIADKAAEGIAETYNSLADLYKGIAKKTQNILDKVNKGEKITKKEQDDLEKLKAKANENMSQATDLVIKKWGSSGSEPFIAFVKSASESCACSAETETAKPKKGPSAYEEITYFYGDDCKKCLEEQKEKQAKLALAAKKMEDLLKSEMVCGCSWNSISSILQSVGDNGDCEEIAKLMNQVKKDLSESGFATAKINYLVSDENKPIGQISIAGECIDKFSIDMIPRDGSGIKINKDKKDSHGDLAVEITGKVLTITDSQDRSAEMHIKTDNESQTQIIEKWLFTGGKSNSNATKIDFTGSFNEELLKKVFPNVKPEFAKEMLPYLNTYLKESGMTNCKERIMFFTQIAEETDNLGLLTEEKSEWASSSSKYKGRGLFQLTGKANYKNFQKYCNDLGDDVDFISYPEKVANEPKYSVQSAFWYWNVNNCKKYASNLTEENMLKIAKITNCGSVGSNCSHDDEDEPCESCKPNGWERRKKEFTRLKDTFLCK
jgi:predicted chitinase